MCMSILPTCITYMYLCAVCMSDIHRVNRALNPMELKLQMVMWVLGIEPGSCARQVLYTAAPSFQPLVYVLNC